MTIRNILAVLALTFTFGSGVALAEEAKVPVTAADHMAMSKSYAEKAATYRAEAAYHKQMAAAYAKELHLFQKGSGFVPPGCVFRPVLIVDDQSVAVLDFFDSHYLSS